MDHIHVCEASVALCDDPEDQLVLSVMFFDIDNSVLNEKELGTSFCVNCIFKTISESRSLVEP